MDTPPVPDILYLSAKLTSVETMGGIFCSICQQTYRDKKEFDVHYLYHNPDPKETVYTCVACFKEIKGYPSFRSHCYNIHTAKYKYKCKYCPKTFSKDQNLREHEQSIHTDIFKCDYIGPPHCNKKFSSEEELTQHRLASHAPDGPPYACRSCARPVASTDDCERHIEQHARFTYTCPICEEHIGEKPLLKEHLLKHFGDEPIDSDEDNDTEEGKPEDSSVDLLGGIQCYVCLEAIKNRPEFDIHFKTTHPEAEFFYSCTICDKQYNEYHRLGRHYYDHLMKDRFSCSTCGRAFGRLTRLVQHAAGCATRCDKLFRCALCPVRAATPRRLAEHARKVHQSNVLMCPHDGCQEQFTKPSALVYHEVLAHQRGDGWCRRCGLPLPALAAALRHVEVHRAALYGCPCCGREYREKHLLLKHVPRHFESVLHVCKICGKVYNAKNRLVAHTKTHSDIQANECSYCGKRFATQYKFKQHLNIHTGARPYQCTVCPKTFTNHPNWSKHLKKMHKIDPKNIKVKRAPAKQITNNNTASDDNFEMMDLDLPETPGSDTELDSIEPTVLDVVSGVYQGLGSELVCNAVTYVYEDHSGVASDSSSQDAAPPPAPPCSAPLFPDDAELPHIDPRLTVKDYTLDNLGFDSFEHNIALAILANSRDDSFM